MRIADARGAERPPDGQAEDSAVDRRAEIDAEYAGGYGQHPLDERDAWGDLESWHVCER